MPLRERAKNWLGHGSSKGKRGKGKANAAAIGNVTEASNSTVTGNQVSGQAAGQISKLAEEPNHGSRLGGPGSTPVVVAQPRISSPVDPRKQTLWDEAYDIVCKKERDLMEAYEKDLLSFQDKQFKSAKGNILGATREIKLQNLIDFKLRDIENSPLKISVGKKEIIVKEQIGKIVRAVLVAKDFIGSAVSAEPHAALAWAGVLVVLPPLLNPTTQDADATDGLEYLSELLLRCKVMEDTYLTCSPQSESDMSQPLQNLRLSFTSRTIKLYTQILRYQIRFARQYSRLGLFQYLRDVVIIDNWKTMLTDLKKTEETIRFDLSAVDSHTLMKMDNSVSEVRKKADKIFALQMEMKDQMETIGQNQLLEKLPRADAAAFDSFEDRKRVKCLEGTRVDILKQISEWGAGHGNESIFWLSGLAGTGKSTIAQTIADVFGDTNYLGASFFFSRGKADRGDAHVLFSTLALQLAETSPTLKINIADSIKSNSSIGYKTLLQQWKHLILQPLSELDKRLLLSLVLVFVIDALDECAGDEDVRTVLRLFNQVQHLQNIRVRVFITSRPETAIRLGFDEMPGILHRDMVLQHVPQSVIEHDISTYLRHKLSKIRKEKSLGEDWPGEDAIETLLEKAGRLFIYAATVCTFLKQARFPERRLSDMLSVASNSYSSTKDLDQMYMLILTCSISEACDEDQEDMARLFKQIIGSVIMLFSTLSSASLVTLLGVSSYEMAATLEGLHSVLDISKYDDSPIQLVHPSFRDFLLNNERCSDLRFWIDDHTTHKTLFWRCIQILSEYLKRDICNLQVEGIQTKDISGRTIKEHIPPHVQYAARYWIPHLVRSDIGLSHTADDDHYIREVYEFLLKHYLHWLEVLSIIGEGFGGQRLTYDLEDWAEERCFAIDKMYALCEEVHHFATNFRPLLETSPLQVYNSALIFSPKGSLIRKNFWSDAPTWIKRLPTVLEEWPGPFLQGDEEPEQKSGEGPMSVSFSPNGQLLAYAWDRKVGFWNVRTGNFEGNLDTETNLRRRLEFSPDGQFLATISDDNDNRVMLWNANTRMLCVSLEGHSRWINDISFSPDSQLLASSSDNTVLLCSVKTGVRHATLAGHSSWVTTVAFSPGGRILATASYDGTIRLWESKMGQALAILQGHTSWITAVTFSSNGQLLASGSSDKTIRLWNLQTRIAVCCLEGHLGSISSLVFSPNSNFIASFSEWYKDPIIRLWNINEKRTVQKIDKKGFIFKLSFSDDGSSIETNRENLFWFPPEYEPTCVAFQDNVLAIGHDSGQVTFMEFFLGAIPLRQVSRT